MNDNNLNIKSNVIITDLLFYLLTHWKSILALGIICTLLMSGLSYYKSAKSISSDKENSSGTDTMNFDDEEIENLDITATNLAGYYKERDSILEYCDNSPVMQSDPMSVVKMTLSYKLTVYGNDSDPVGKLSTIVALYNAIPINSDFLQNASEKSGIKAEYITGMIQGSNEDISASLSSGSVNTTSTSADTTTDLSIVGSTILDETKNQSSIYQYEITGPTESIVKSVGEQLNKAVSTITDKYNIDCSNFECLPLIDSISTYADYNISSTQLSAYGRLYDINAKINNITSSLTNNEITYINNKIEQIDQAVEEIETEDSSIAVSDSSSSEGIDSKPSINKKYVLTGFILGIFISALFWIIKYAFGKKINSVYDFKNKYFNNMYLISKSDKSTRLHGSIDKMRYSGMHIYEDTNLAGMIAAEIDLNMQDKTDKNKICFVGIDISEDNISLINKIKNNITSDNVDLISVDHINDNADNLKKAYDAYYIYVIGNLNVTDRAKYTELMNFISMMNMNLKAAIIYI